MKLLSNLLLAGVLLIGGAVCTPLHAQDKPAGYPQRPIRIIVPVLPGGGLDMVCRAVGQMLSERWRQTVVVDNRPGGGTVIATEIAAKAAADGYTLLAATDTLNIIGAMKRVPFDVRMAFEPVVPMTAQPYVLIVGAGLAAKSVKELAVYSQSHSLSYGSSGVGTVGHLGMERLANLAGAKWVHVPYKGGSASLVGLMSGEVHLYPGLVISATAAMKSGKVRALAALGLKRLPALPDLPTVAEQGWPGFKIVNSYNLFAPAGTPRPIVDAVNRAVGDFMHTPAMAQRLIADGSHPGERYTPEAFKAFLAREYQDVERQVKTLNVKLY
ncbi:MAG: tripartite tricarboxylate transporter substrate binding protein [Betaproteobacteria bacterium]|nr:tripartite tricarboxylate transporter substrate binding protein [Betaproteobacteria bacterium]